MTQNMCHMHMRVKHNYASAHIERIRIPAHIPVMATPTRHKTFLREWRKMKPGRTLEMVAAELHISQPQLGRIEKGQQPYNQDLLEALADLYGCTVADLLMRNPTEPDAIWSIWDQAKPGQRRQIVEVAKTLVRTGTDG
ncbi:helix-turn-helix domain-containing protein [Sphingomonas sp. SAFR-052]